MLAESHFQDLDRVEFLRQRKPESDFEYWKSEVIELPDRLPECARLREFWGAIIFLKMRSLKWIFRVGPLDI